MLLATCVFLYKTGVLLINRLQKCNHWVRLPKEFLSFKSAIKLIILVGPHFVSLRDTQSPDNGSTLHY